MPKDLFEVQTCVSLYVCAWQENFCTQESLSWGDSGSQSDVDVEVLRWGFASLSFYLTPAHESL